MPFDCDSYWHPDPERDADIWPVPMRRQVPVALVLLSVLVFLAWLAF